jgi:hypothetical protein
MVFVLAARTLSKLRGPAFNIDQEMSEIDEAISTAREVSLGLSHRDQRTPTYSIGE